MAQIFTLVPRKEYEQQASHARPEEYYPQNGAPYGFHLQTFVNRWGMPCWKSPYGTLSAYDLTSGKLLWRNPFGEVQKWGF